MKIRIVAGKIGWLLGEREAGDGGFASQPLGQLLKEGLGFVRGVAVAHRVDEEEGHGLGVKVGLDVVSVRDAEDKESRDEEEQ